MMSQRAKQVVWNQLLTPLRAEVIDEFRRYFEQARTHLEMRLALGSRKTTPVGLSIS